MTCKAPFPDRNKLERIAEQDHGLIKQHVSCAGTDHSSKDHVQRQRVQVRQGAPFPLEDGAHDVEAGDKGRCEEQAVPPWCQESKVDEDGVNVPVYHGR